MANSRNCPTPWLGIKRGYLSDWITQRWVQVTGRRINLQHDAWIAGPVGKPTGIGKDFFDELARESGLEIRRAGAERGLISDLRLLASPSFDPRHVHPEVADFYERTSAYDLDAWSEWCGLFRPFGGLLAFLFSRRLQQRNVPLSALDTSRGISSEVIQLVDRSSGEVRHTAWVRELVGSGNVLYAGSYSLCQVPGHTGPCVKVVFPLPNGSAVVIMKPEDHADGSLTVTSSGRRFGEPGFYFVVHNADGSIWARYVRALCESIHVYPAMDGGIRADHVLTLWGARFLRLHYRLRRKTLGESRPAA